MNDAEQDAADLKVSKMMGYTTLGPGRLYRIIAKLAEIDSSEYQEKLRQVQIELDTEEPKR